MANGVQVTGKIVPLATAVPSFPVTEDTLGQGGYRCVATITDRDALLSKTPFLKAGMLCFVQSLLTEYVLSEDLTDWIFYNASPELWNQDTWEVDAAAGDDSNTGKPGHPLRTSEELCRRLCPRGAPYVPQNLTTTINFAAGAYGSLILNGYFPESVGVYGAVVLINCAFSASAPIVLSAVVPPVPATKTRGQVTTIGATAFTDNARIRCISGAASGAVTCSMGPNANAKNHFVKEWWNYDANALQSPAPGDTVQIETCLCSFTRCAFNVNGPGYWQFNYPEIHGDSQWYSSSVGGVLDVVCADFYGDSYNGVSDLWSTFPVFANCRIVSGEVAPSGGGFPSFYGSVILPGARLAMYPGGVMGLLNGNAINGGQLRAIEPAAAIVITHDLEIENGSAINAVEIVEGAMVCHEGGGRMWGASASPYACGVHVSSGSWLKLANNTTAVPDFNCTIQIQLSNQEFAFSDIPLALPRAMCGVIMDGDTTAPRTPPYTP